MYLRKWGYVPEKEGVRTSEIYYREYVLEKEGICTSEIGGMFQKKREYVPQK